MITTDSAGAKPEGKEKAAAAPETQQADKKEKMFSHDSIMSDSRATYPSRGRGDGTVVITPEDKVAFVDAVVNNSRFEKEYSLLGGKVRLRLRSLMADEAQAMASWLSKQGTKDPTGIMSGKYRKYLMAAQVSMLNGVEMPPLEEPLFETLGSDGMVKGPGWVSRSEFWDKQSSGLVQMVSQCITDFDNRYTIMCKNAEDENFWNPDTP